MVKMVLFGKGQLSRAQQFSDLLSMELPFLPLNPQMWVQWVQLAEQQPGTLAKLPGLEVRVP